MTKWLRLRSYVGRIRRWRIDRLRRRSRPVPGAPVRVLYRRSGFDFDGPLMCVTHSDRPLERERCSLSFLQQRCGRPDRLPPATPFHSLLPASSHVAWGGRVTIWDFESGDLLRPRLAAVLWPRGYKPQCARWHRGRLWILGIEQLRLYDADFNETRCITDPWMADGHTMFPDDDGGMVLSCSASDAILRVDGAAHIVTAAQRLPAAVFGVNYELRREDSVVEHYIPQDLQAAHLNAAFPAGDRVLATTFIQGAVGFLDAENRWHEITRGFVGCHGARMDRNRRVYFADSCTGVVCFLDPRGRIIHRLNAHSVWLHDAEALPSGIVVCSVSDRNRLEWRAMEGTGCELSLPCRRFGATTQFIACSGM